ncbi:recombination regulator RecX [Pleionea sp. CnH1-48]|uniref:recombination regulator RecX n=1 Tax=Pleionea sp. CnH1-48 TaxID=2954494 RepID=UPI002097A3EB|nr:recombination regulator RecX [Pleionea sp. CnH1-48]MCO7225970.1 recombination regulator RecX [Pleionea sp. CnH1-48]
MKAKTQPDSARHRAIGLLTRREHSRRELHQKLLQKGYVAEEIQLALDDLEQRNWLSDERFAESWIRYRAGRLYGPARIRMELKEKGVDSAIIDAAFAESEVDWIENAVRVREKKYRNAPSDWKEKAKQQRYLQYRGFSNDIINIVFEEY